MEHVHAYTDIDSTTNINHFLSLFFSLGSSVNRREKERGNPLSNRIRAGNRIYIYIYSYICFIHEVESTKGLKYYGISETYCSNTIKNFSCPLSTCFSATTAINQNFKVILSLSLSSLLLFIPLAQPRYLKLSPA